MSKTILITGASSGIGKALVNEFGRRGHKVIATSRTIEQVDDLPNGVIKIRHDVADYSSTENLINEISNLGLEIDVLINNAGYGLTGPALELPLSQIEEEFKVNVFGALKLAQIVGRGMAEKESGVIANIGSVSGMLTTPFASAYCASKAEVNAFSDALRLELNPFGVKVITVTPGAIVSKFGETSANIARDLLPSNSLYDKYKEKILERARLSQKDATPVEDFAKRLADKILSKNPPPNFRYGKMSFLAWFLSHCFSYKLRDKILLKKFGL
jgi:short-subunit dehydrogenase